MNNYNHNILFPVFTNLKYDDSLDFKRFYDWAKSFYNHKELNRRSGLPYMTHIDDLLDLALNKYDIYDSEILKIIIGHDILEENDSLMKKTNNEKGYRRDKLEKKLTDFINPYELEGIKCLTHDEDISKLEKVSKVLSHNDLKYTIVKSLDIIGNSNDHPENLRFESKLNKIFQADLVEKSLKNVIFDDLDNKYNYLTYDNLQKIIKDLKKGRNLIFELLLKQ